MIGPASAPVLRPVSLSDLTASPLASRLLAAPALLLIDCEGRLLPHPLGVCRFVAQLLQLHQRGASLWLSNVHPELRRSLHHLGLGAVLHLTG